MTNRFLKVLLCVCYILLHIKYTSSYFYVKNQYTSVIQVLKPSHRRCNSLTRLYESIALNKKSSFEYEFDEKFEAGIQLCGTEVKSCRKGGAVQLSDGYATVINGECWLCNVYIAEYYQSGPVYQHELKRNRKLLLHKREDNL